MFQKVGCASVIAIEVEDFSKQTMRLACATHAGQGLRAKKQCIDVMAPYQILIEQQHGREGSGEVVDLRWCPFKLHRVIVYTGKNCRRLILVPQSFQG